MKILLLTIGGFSHVNEKLIQHFSYIGHECVQVDMLDYIARRNVLKHPMIIGLSLLEAVRRDPKHAIDNFKKTVHAFKALTKIATRIVKNIECDVILQTQVFFTIDRKIIEKPYYPFSPGRCSFLQSARD